MHLVVWSLAAWAVMLWVTYGSGERAAGLALAVALGGAAIVTSPIPFRSAATGWALVALGTAWVAAGVLRGVGLALHLGGVIVVRRAIDAHRRVLR